MQNMLLNNQSIINELKKASNQYHSISKEVYDKLSPSEKNDFNKKLTSYLKSKKSSINDKVSQLHNKSIMALKKILYINNLLDTKQRQELEKEISNTTQELKTKHKSIQYISKKNHDIINKYYTKSLDIYNKLDKEEKDKIDSFFSKYTQKNEEATKNKINNTILIFTDLIKQKYYRENLLPKKELLKFKEKFEGYEQILASI